MVDRFENKVAWITGGGSGIGRGIALELARQGADVVISGRRQERLDEVAAEIEALGRRGVAIVCDVTDDSQIETAVERILDELGHLDVAVANAGFGVAGRVETLTSDDWRRQMDVNVIGLAATIRHTLPALRKTSGRVALVGSVSGTIATPGMGAYSASKYAVRAIGQTLSMELHGSGVSCTTIQPGFVESEIGRVDNRGQFDSSRKDQRPKAIMWSTERAARVIVRAIYRRKREFTFTGHGRMAAFLGKHTPGFVHFAVTRFASKQIQKSLKDGSSADATT